MTGEVDVVGEKWLHGVSGDPDGSRRQYLSWLRSSSCQDIVAAGQSKREAWIVENFHLFQRFVEIMSLRKDSFARDFLEFRDEHFPDEYVSLSTEQ